MTSVVPQEAENKGRALQAAEKLDFPESAKNGSRHDAPGTIREGSLMVLHPANFALSPSIRSFSAACLAPAKLRAAPKSNTALFPQPLKPLSFWDISGTIEAAPRYKVRWEFVESHPNCKKRS
jgi:hypothetical protein